MTRGGQEMVVEQCRNAMGKLEKLEKGHAFLQSYLRPY